MWLSNCLLLVFILARHSLLPGPYPVSVSFQYPSLFRQRRITLNGFTTIDHIGQSLQNVYECHLYPLTSAMKTEFALGENWDNRLIKDDSREHQTVLWTFCQWGASYPTVQRCNGFHFYKIMVINKNDHWPPINNGGSNVPITLIIGPSFLSYSITSAMCSQGVSRAFISKLSWYYVPWYNGWEMINEQTNVYQKMKQT